MRALRRKCPEHHTGTLLAYLRHSTRRHRPTLVRAGDRSEAEFQTGQVVVRGVVRFAVFFDRAEQSANSKSSVRCQISAQQRATAMPQKTYPKTPPDMKSPVPCQVVITPKSYDPSGNKSLPQRGNLLEINTVTNWMLRTMSNKCATLIFPRQCRPTTRMRASLSLYLKTNQ
jgi:hypothetical protein